MIFSTGLKKIYESIKKESPDKQKQLLESLSSKIAASPALAHKFELLEKIQSKRKSFTPEGAQKFVAKLKAKHDSFLQNLNESNKVAVFYKEEKKLFEYFNINQKEVISNNLDMIVNKKDNQLNENIIIEYVVDNRLMSGKNALLQKIDALRENYAGIKATNDDFAFDRQMDIISKLNESIDDSDKHKLIESSIKVIKEESYKDFGKAVEKAYKLRMITEKILKEYADDYDENDEPKGVIYRGSKVPDLSIIKNISIEVPKLANTDSIVCEFSVPIYPPCAYLSDNLVEIPNIKNTLLKLKRPLINKFIYQKQQENPEYRIIDPVNCNWDVSMSSVNVDPKKGIAAKEVAERGFYSIGAHFTMIISIAKVVDSERYFKLMYQILKDFNDYLPTMEMLADVITPDSQKEVLSGATEGRKSSYGDRSKDVYYDKRTHNPMLNDKHSDSVLSGTVEDTNVGQAEEMSFANDETPAGMDDDAIDKMATANAKKNKFSKGPRY